MNSNFKEFEHKYLLKGNEDVDQIFQKLRSLGNGSEKSLEVIDTYYFDESRPHLVYRHRIDREIQQLTVKSLGGDARDRMEINLHLLNDFTQDDSVGEFFNTLGNFRKSAIHKSIRVIDFPDCECVYYRASSDQKTVFCFEFEALGANDLSEALSIISRYEQVAGFSPEYRCSESLFELLVVQPVNK